LRLSGGLGRPKDNRRGEWRQRLGMVRGCGCAFVCSLAAIISSLEAMDCSSAAHYSRLFFTTGTYSPASSYLLSNISVISCATDYQAVNGTLEIAVTSSSSAPAIRRFTRPARNGTSKLSIRNEVGWPLIEEGMLQPVVFNPSLASRATSEFGSTVLYVAENLPKIWRATHSTSRRWSCPRPSRASSPRPTPSVRPWARSIRSRHKRPLKGQ
jgi:hypothetical protein